MIVERNIGLEYALKRFNAQKYYLPKGIIDNYSLIISVKNWNDYQPNDYDIRRSEEIRKLKTGQDEDHTTWSFLDYDYVKNHYRLIPNDLSWQKGLDADPKASQQI